MSVITFSRFGYKIGSHVPFQKNLEKTLTFSISLGMYTFQIFLGSPQSFRRTTLDKKDIEKCLSILDRFPTSIFVHAPYVLNLAGSKEILAWNGDDEQDQKTLAAIRSVESDLNQTALFGKGVVLHPGTYKDKKKGCEAIAKSISQIDFHPMSNLILENMAGQGSVIGSSLEELRDIRNMVDKDKQKHVSFCIDTAHIWGKGLYHLNKKEGIDKMFQDIEDILGWENISLFHLNDSMVKCGSCVDRHHLLGEGEIWEKNKDMLHYLLERLKCKDIPCVMETDPSDMIKFLD